MTLEERLNRWFMTHRKNRNGAQDRSQRCSPYSSAWPSVQVATEHCNKGRRTYAIPFAYNATTTVPSVCLRRAPRATSNIAIAICQGACHLHTNPRFNWNAIAIPVKSLRQFAARNRKPYSLESMDLLCEVHGYRKTITHAYWNILAMHFLCVRR